MSSDKIRGASILFSLMLLAMHAILGASRVEQCFLAKAKALKIFVLLKIARDFNKRGEVPARY